MFMYTHSRVLYIFDKKKFCIKFAHIFLMQTMFFFFIFGLKYDPGHLLDNFLCFSPSNFTLADERN